MEGLPHVSLGVPQHFSGHKFLAFWGMQKTEKGVEQDTVLKLPLLCRAAVFYSHIKTALTGMCGILTL